MHRKFWRTLRAGLVVALAFEIGQLWHVQKLLAATSTWNPTKLVNTEATQVIDEGDSNSNIQFQFGQNLGKKLYYDRTNIRFAIEDKFYVSGGLTVTGATIMNIGRSTSGPDAGLALEVIGAMSGSSIHAQDLLTSSGKLVVTGNVKVDGGTFFIDTVANRVGINTLIPETDLEVVGTASGRILRAQDTLASSGTLSVNGAATLGSTLKIGGVTYTFPYSDGTASGKVLKTSGAGVLVWSTDNTGAASLLAGQGLSIVNNNMYKLNATITGSTLKFTTISGGQIFAKDFLRSSGALVVRSTQSLPVLITDMTNGRVGINKATPNTALEVIGTTSGRLIHAQNRIESSGTLSVRTATAQPALVTDNTNARIGVGWKTPHSTITDSGSFATTFKIETTNYSLDSTDSVILADATGGAFSATLPTAVGITGRQYTIKKVDVTLSNIVTVATTSSQTIDGLSSWLLHEPGEELTVMSDGSNWRVLNFDPYDAYSHFPKGSTLARYETAPNNGTALGSSTVTANSLFAIPINVSKVTQVDQLAISVVVTVATSTARAGLYRDNGNTYPGALVADASSVTTTTAGFKTLATNLPKTIQPGLYWLAAAVSTSTTLTLKTFALTGLENILGYDNTTTAIFGWSVAYTCCTNALPDPYTAGGAVVKVTPIPAIFARFLQ